MSDFHVRTDLTLSSMVLNVLDPCLPGSTTPLSTSSGAGPWPLCAVVWLCKCPGTLRTRLKRWNTSHCACLLSLASPLYCCLRPARATWRHVIARQSLNVNRSTPLPCLTVSSLVLVSIYRRRSSLQECGAALPPTRLSMPSSSPETGNTLATSRHGTDL
jgi:hypothetical protein